jgi:hypothetical protein
MRIDESPVRAIAFASHRPPRARVLCHACNRQLGPGRCRYSGGEGRADGGTNSDRVAQPRDRRSMPNAREDGYRETSSSASAQEALLSDPDALPLAPDRAQRASRRALSRPRHPSRTDHWPPTGGGRRMVRVRCGSSQTPRRTVRTWFEARTGV